MMGGGVEAQVFVFCQKALRIFWRKDKGDRIGYLLSSTVASNWAILIAAVAILLCLLVNML